MANIKLGNDTLTGVSKIKVTNADDTSQLVEFSEGGGASGTKTIVATSVSPVTVDVAEYANASVSVGDVTLGANETLNVYGNCCHGDANAIDITAHVGQININKNEDDTKNIGYMTFDPAGSNCELYYRMIDQPACTFGIVEGVRPTTPVSLWYLNDYTGENVDFMTNGKILAVEPKSYYSWYSKSEPGGAYFSEDGVFFNSTLTDTQMNAFFNALQYEEVVSGLPVETLSSMWGSDMQGSEFLIAINATTVQSGLKILAIIDYDTGTGEVYNMIPVYATADFTISGITGVQGWQNIEYNPSGEGVGLDPLLKDYYTLPLKDIFACEKVAFGTTGGGAETCTLTITNEAEQYTNQIVFIDSQNNFHQTSSGTYTIKKGVPIIVLMAGDESYPSYSGSWLNFEESIKNVWDAYVAWMKIPNGDCSIRLFDDM